MKRKIYTLLSMTKQCLFASALSLFAGASYAQVTYTFNYTGNVQTMTLAAGNYEIECWGANGGDMTLVNTGGGKGGYSKGVYTNVTPGTQINILVGGKGGNAVGTSGAPGSGGWNGGGGGGKTGRTGAGGGGASDVRVGGLAANNRIIVAGGGGGSAYYNQVAMGGNGGAQVAQNGDIVTSGNITTVGGGGQGANGNAPGLSPNNVLNTNGTATGGGGGGQSPGIGSGGQGTGGGAGGYAGGSGSGSTGSSGGGGGGYAGGAGGTQTANVGAAGGGGSGYVGGVTSGVSLMFGQTSFVNNPIVAGNGLVLVKELCNITLAANGVNGNGAICAGSTVTITTNAVSNYSWNTGATTPSIVVSPASTTVYSLTATSPSNCTSSNQITITVNTGTPNLVIANTSTASGGICPTRTVVITASGATTYTWTGGTPLTNGVAFAPLTTSGYTVTAQNACGTATAVTSVSIHPVPTLTAVASTATLCSGNTATLTGTGANSYTWYPLSSNVQNGVSFFPTTSQTYTLVGENALTCTNSAQATIGVTQTPILAPVSTSSLICDGNSATLTASGASSYSWNTGALTPDIVISPNVTTSYTVTKWNANCVDVKTLTIYVNQPPVVLIQATSGTVCALQSVTLTTGGGTGYTWTPAGGSTFTAIVVPASTTIYTAAVSDGTCVNSNTIEIVTKANPTITIVSTKTAVCSGDSLTINVDGAVSYNWATPFLSGNSVTVAPTTTTVYAVTGTNSLNCTSSTGQFVLVHPLPTVTAVSSRSLVCSGSPATLTANGNSNSYTWAHGPSGTATTVNPITNTTYTVTGTILSTQCTNTNVVTVNVFTPSFVTTNDTAICQGGFVILTASGANSYTWQGFGQVPSIQVSPTVATMYTVNALSSSAGNYVTCPSTKQVVVNIFTNPVITAANSRAQICRGESVNLIAGGGNTYVWSGGTNATGSLIPVSPLQETKYTVTGTDIFGCTNTATVGVRVSACPGIAENKNNSLVMVYPNPNNGVFAISAESEMHLSLMNELGQLVYTIQLSAENNFKADVKGLARGIYFITGTSAESNISSKIIVH